MQMQSDLKAVPMQGLYLLLNEINGRVCAELLYFFKFADLDKVHEACIPPPEDLSEYLSRVIDQLSERAFAVSIYFVIKSEDASNHDDFRRSTGVVRANDSPAGDRPFRTNRRASAKPWHILSTWPFVMISSRAAMENCFLNASSSSNSSSFCFNWCISPLGTTNPFTPSFKYMISGDASPSSVTIGSPQ